jgi:hypothetical protein
MRQALALTVVAAGLLATACGGGGGGSEALPLGTKATVGYQQSGGPRTTLGITVLAVRKGTQEQLKQGGFQVDAENRSDTPYYVDARYENQGNQTVKRDVSVGLEDKDGNLIGSTLIFDYGGKPYAHCKNVSGGTLGPNQTFEDCTLFLVPKDVDVGRVNFLSDEGPGKEPRFVYWDAGVS